MALSVQTASVAGIAQFNNANNGGLRHLTTAAAGIPAQASAFAQFGLNPAVRWRGRGPNAKGFRRDWGTRPNDNRVPLSVKIPPFVPTVPVKVSSLSALAANAVKIGNAKILAVSGRSIVSGVGVRIAQTRSVTAATTSIAGAFVAKLALSKLLAPAATGFSSARTLVVALSRSLSAFAQTVIASDKVSVSILRPFSAHTISVGVSSSIRSVASAALGSRPATIGSSSPFLLAAQSIRALSSSILAAPGGSLRFALTVASQTVIAAGTSSIVIRTTRALATFSNNIAAAPRFALSAIANLGAGSAAISVRSWISFATGVGIGAARQFFAGRSGTSLSPAGATLSVATTLQSAVRMVSAGVRRLIRFLLGREGWSPQIQTRFAVSRIEVSRPSAACSPAAHVDAVANGPIACAVVATTPVAARLQVTEVAD